MLINNYPTPHVWGARTDNPDGVTNERLNDAQDYAAGRLDFEAALSRQFAVDPSTTSGLTFGYQGGNTGTEASPVVVADGTVALTASATRIVQLNRVTGAVTAGATLTAGNLPLHSLTCDGSQITVWNDLRAWGRGDAAALKFRGAYNGATAYVANDVVTSGGATWRAVQATTGNAPVEGANWSALGGGGDGHVIEDEGTPLAARTNLNFVGDGVVTTDDSGDDATVVTIERMVATQKNGVDAGIQRKLNFIQGENVIIEASQNDDNDSVDVTINAIQTPGYGGSSTDSVFIALGSTDFTVQAGLAYVVGSRVRFASAAHPDMYMEGRVTAYTGTTMTVDVDNIGGSSDFADWNLSLAGDVGPAGSGATGAGYGGTSTSSVAIATGSKVFITQAGMAYQDGARVRITVSTDVTKWVEGTITAYVGTSMTVNVDTVGGTGTFSSWNINLSGVSSAVISVNGHTGAVTGMAELGVAQTFTQRQSLGALAILRGNPITLTADEDALDNLGLSSVNILQGTPGFSISGIKVPGGTDGLFLRIVNASPYPLTMVHNGTAGTGADQIFCPGGVDLVVPAQGEYWVDFNTETYISPGSTASRWVVQGAGSVSASGGLLAANDLSDVASPSASRGHLGSTTVGDAVFVASSEAAAQSALGVVPGTDVASLVSGKVPSGQLPSYVDDVLEFANLAAFPGTGETGKIYVALDTNLLYRWGGSAYFQVGGADTIAVQDEDGTPNVAATGIKFPNTSVTDNGDGTASIDFGSVLDRIQTIAGEVQVIGGNVVYI